MVSRQSSARLISDDAVETVFARLRKAMPGRTKTAKGPKGQPNAYRSCISCMLSAQSLDSNTAKAARALFALATTPEDMLALDDEVIADAIKPCGLYNMKTRNIRAFNHALLVDHAGVVPDCAESMQDMPEWCPIRARAC